MANRHVARAKNEIGQGETHFGAAAQELIAARDQDDLSWAEIDRQLGRGRNYARRFVESWRRGAAAPFAEPHRETPDLRGAKRVLREAPLEQVEQIIGQLPKERQQTIAAAAGHAYHKTRVEHDERERNLTHQERQQREIAADRLTRPARRAVAGFTTLGIVGHLEQATEELRELVADASLTPEHVEQIDAAMHQFTTELEVARGVAEVG